MSRKFKRRAHQVNSHFIIFTAVVLLVLAIFKNVSSKPYVLGENVLGPCSSGVLTTSTNKIYQMTYPDETFQQLTNIDLLKDVSQLKDLTCLQYLDATDRSVKGDIKDLTNLVNLEVFSLYSNPDVSGDICSLSGATKLRSLKLAFDPKITGDIACLKNLTKLETFAMTQTNITGDISVFANMPNLKAVYVSGTYVKGNICSLGKLTNLEELGIADEYPGNPDITGDLSCLNNLTKLKRFSIYNTRTTNCEAFTKAHPDMDKTVTESGKQGGGGCSKESMKTLVDYAQKYEEKIGTRVQTKVRGQPNYNAGTTGGFGPGNNAGANNGPQMQDDRNILQKIVSFIFGLFGKNPPGPGGEQFENRRSGSPGSSMPQGVVGPGGCRSRSECETYCSDPTHSEECTKFAPPDRR